MENLIENNSQFRFFERYTIENEKEILKIDKKDILTKRRYFNNNNIIKDGVCKLSLGGLNKPSDFTTFIDENKHYPNNIFYGLNNWDMLDEELCNLIKLKDYVNYTKLNENELYLLIELSKYRVGDESDYDFEFIYNINIIKNKFGTVLKNRRVCCLFRTVEYVEYCTINNEKINLSLDDLTEIFINDYDKKKYVKNISMIVEKEIVSELYKNRLFQIDSFVTEKIIYKIDNKFIIEEISSGKWNIIRFILLDNFI